MTVRTILVAVNALAWLAVVALREPMPESYFAERDAARGEGRFVMSSSDPFLVLAGRPLWIASHRREPLLVRMLALANAVPLFAVAILDGFVQMDGWVSTYTRSMLALAGLLLLTSAQWWLAGTAGMRFQAWREERCRAAA